MSLYTAVFTKGANRERLLTLILTAESIQQAIDEAVSRCLPAEKRGADRINIFRDGNIIETVGIGKDPCMT